MKRNSIIIANWKMKMGLGETVRLTKEIVDGLKDKEGEGLSEVVLCPSYIATSEVAEVLDSTDPKSSDPSTRLRAGGASIKLGAQDVFWEESGAYTGEISVLMLKDLGCEYIIIGHSERREYLGETDEMVNKKIRAILRADLVPILCVGETQEERNIGKKDYRVIQQVEQALRHIKLFKSQELIIAYEPVWVIGTGQAVAASEAKYMVDLIKHVALDFCPEESLRVIYGGSVDSGNISEFRDVDGFLVGTAALDSREFLRMIESMGK